MYTTIYTTLQQPDPVRRFTGTGFFSLEVAVMTTGAARIKQGDIEMQIRSFFIVLGMILVFSGFSLPVTATPGSTGGQEFNPDTYQVPVLQFDRTQEKIIIKKEMSLLLPAPQSPIIQAASMAGTSEQAADVYIPSGSIIHHSRGGTTTVFDPAGVPLFFADDADSVLIPTPSGALPATCVHEVPSGSVIYSKNQTSFVIYNNDVILVEINEKTKSADNTGFRSWSLKSFNLENPSVLGAMESADDTYPDVHPLYWIERVAGDMDHFRHGDELKDFSAEWKIPAIPASTRANQVQYLAIDAEVFYCDSNGNCIDHNVMPVLEWNYYPNQWDITTWLHSYHDSGIGYFSTREIVNTGDTIRGEIHHSFDDVRGWQVIARNQNGISSTLSFNPIKSEIRGNQISVALMASGYGAMSSEDNLVGDTTFTDFIIVNRDDYTVTGGVDIGYEYINSLLKGKPGFMDLAIENAWPEKVVLKTQGPHEATIEKTFSITNAWVDYFEPYDIKFDAKKYIRNITRGLIEESSWKLAYPEKDGSSVTKAQFGVNPAPFDKTLNDATLHWHIGHGGTNSDTERTAIAIPTLNPTTKMLENDWLYAEEITTKWGGKNKWIVIQACDIMKDPEWGAALGTTHGIFGFTTTTYVKSTLPSVFLNYAKSGKTLYDSWYGATRQVYRDERSPTTWISDSDGVSHPDYQNNTIPVSAAVRFKTIEQRDHDHLPGICDIIVPDGDPNNIESVQTEWNCATGEMVQS